MKQYSPSHAHVEVWKYRWRAEERLQAVTTYTFLGRPNTAWEKTIPGNLEVHLTDFTVFFSEQFPQHNELREFIIEH